MKILNAYDDDGDVIDEFTDSWVVVHVPSRSLQFPILYSAAYEAEQAINGLLAAQGRSGPPTFTREQLRTMRVRISLFDNGM